MKKLTKLTAIHSNFLEHHFDEKYNLIVMNPPWKEFGVQFIDKGVNLLEDNGELVVVMDYNKFTRSGLPGTFLNLQSRGQFKFIRCDSSRNKEGPFPGIGDSIAFVFVKTKKPVVTTIKNRTGQTFQYKLKKNEKYPPQIPNEDQLFDWDQGIKIASQGAGQKFKVPTIVFTNRATVDKIKFGVYGINSEKNFSGARVLASDVDQTKFKAFLDKWNTVFWDNYCVSHGWMRFPPFRKDLDFWTIRTKKEKMEEW